MIIILSAILFWGYRIYTGQAIPQIELSGTIEATQVNLSAKLPGSLEFLSVNSGDKVEKGQLIGRVLRVDLAAQKENSALAISKAEAQLRDLTSGARSQELVEAQALVNNAVVNFDKATLDLERITALHQSESISDTELEKAQINLELAKNQLELTKARQSLLNSGTRNEQINAARIEVKKNQASFKASAAALDDTKIVSPLSGTVISRNYEPGEFIPLGAPVVTVADLSNLWIKVFISTDDLPKIKLKQKVTFTVNGLSDRFSGTIIEIANKGEFTPKTIQTKQERTNIVFPLKIKIENPGNVFKPGMPADVTISDESL